MPRRAEKLYLGQHYHLYNRGINRGRIYFENENCLFFLRKMRQYLLPVMDVIAYCLMPTHYHVLVRVKEVEERRSSKTSEVFVSGVSAHAP